jgi:hypothetical protein
MRLTIIPIDKVVYKDGVPYFNLNMPFIPENIHALQWYENVGEIEYKGLINESINSLPEWADLAVAEWDKAKFDEENEINLAIAEAQANPSTSTGTQEF